MNAIATIDTSAIIETIPFADLALSPLNPRQSHPDGGIAALAENIRSYGLIQNLAGLRTDAGVEIVAGGRRLAALALLQDDPRFHAIPVKMAPDAETAAVWATSENHQREALHPADEIVEYRRMAEKGADRPAIALAFGVSDAHVMRRLALAGLPDPVIEALRVGEITLAVAAAFTIADDPAQAVAVLGTIRGKGASEAQVRQMLKPAAVAHTDRRVQFAGLNRYREAGGTTTEDLFAGTTFLNDPAILDTVFLDALTEAASDAKDAGWAWAEPLTGAYVGWHEIEERKLSRTYPQAGPVLDAEQEARHEELAEQAEIEGLTEEEQAELDALEEASGANRFTAVQMEHCGVLLFVDRDGVLQMHEGMVLPDDRKAAITAGVLSAPPKSASSAERSPISAKLGHDLAASARAARQDALLRDPKLALHLLAYALTGAASWKNPYGISTTMPDTIPSTETGAVRDKKLAKIATDAAERRHVWDAPEPVDFATFRKKGDKRIMAALHVHLCSLLDVSDPDLGALIDKATQKRTRETWTPTVENFLGRVNGAYLDALWRELLDLAPEHPSATTFAKLKKREKAERLEALFGDAAEREARDLTPEQETRIAEWLPEGMA